MTRRTFHQLMTAAAGAAQPPRNAATRAVVQFDSAARTFTVGNSRFQQRLQLTAAGGLELRFFGRTGGRNWAAPRSRWGTGFHSRAAAPPGRRGAPAMVFGLSDPSLVRFAGHEIEDGELRLRFEEPGRKLEYVLHMRGFAEADLVEQWLEVRNRGTETLVGLDRFDPLLLPLALRPSEPCALHYVQGERGIWNRGGENIQPYAPYHFCRTDLPPDNNFLLASRADPVGRRRPPAPAAVRYGFSAPLGGGAGGVGGRGGGGGGLFHFARTRNELVIQGGADGSRRDLAPGASIVSPRVFVGCYQGGVDAGVHEMHRYLRAHVMPPSPDGNFPWTCYNTWYNWNIELDDRALREEARLAASLGLECYYLDAGWYAGSPKTRASFGIGLGAWTENREKFPSGIADFAAYIHSLGMKFGVWVEPERVDSSLVDKPGGALRSSWLAGAGVPESAGREDATRLLCYGNPEVVAWARQTLSRVISEYKVDWLKWDHNFYFVCTRDDHGHQRGDGNYAHIQGVYEVMAHLRREFPKLALENCASGGYRNDLGIIRYANTSWNSDATSPGHRVRYQTTGASYVLPAQYQNSWFVKNPEEPVSENTPPALLDYYFRSRMIGAFGISDRLADWPANMLEAAKRAIAAVKRMRPALAGDVYHLLPQASLFIPPLAPPTEWEAIEYFNPAEQRGVVLCFRAAAEAARLVLPVRGLAGDSRYRVTWNDAGRSETRSGAEWNTAGAAVALSERFTSEILWIERA